MQRLNSIIGILVVLLAALGLPLVLMAQASSQHSSGDSIADTTPLQWVESEELVERAESTLIRMEHGVYMTINTVKLKPKDAFTVWWIIFNYPENCTDNACSPDDVFMMDANGEFILSDNGGQQSNKSGRAAVGFSSLRAVGSVANNDGTAEFRAHLPIGDTIEAVEGPGLLDSMKAEIHLIIRSHGPAIPHTVTDQLNSDWGGCPNGFPKTPCGDVQFTMHRPPHSDN